MQSVSHVTLLDDVPLSAVQGPEMRAKLGIKDNLLRFSTGIEDVEDIWADMAQALDRI